MAIVPAGMHPTNNLGQSGLTRAVFPNQGVYLSRVEIQISVLQYINAIE